MFLAYLQGSDDFNELVYLEVDELNAAVNDLKRYVLENYDEEELANVTILNVVGSLDLETEKWYDELEDIQPVE
jgi:hypothetical protein